MTQASKLKPFGRRPSRFAYRWPARDARINVLCGAVRSSKTWATLPKILGLCRYEVAGQRVITGVSKQTIYQNVLNDLFEIVGEANYSYNRQSGELTLFGVKWLVIGAKDEGSEKYIRGITVGIAVCDEIVLMPRSFFMMLLSRMSPAGARLYATTNPDSPYHWFKSEILDNRDLAHGLGKDLWWQTWTMDDNPNIGEEYKDFIRRSYTGVFYDRFVLGLWVMAQGAIYRDVLTEDVFYTDATRPIGLRNAGGHVERWVSVDYGTLNACVFCEVYDDGQVLWFDREWYHDGRASNLQMTDSQYADALIAWLAEGGTVDRREWPAIIIDPSAASFRAELMNRGFFVMDANNDVLEGIRRASTMLARKKARINRDGCPQGVREMQTYAWDEKAIKRGDEKPIKAHDHWPDQFRYAIQTKINDWRLAV